MTSHSPSATAIAYNAYQELAEAYARLIDTKPHNAYLERPAMVSMWPDLNQKRVLDAGCGPGVYTELLLQLGAIVTAIDISDRMLELARQRLGPTADLRQVDLSQPLTMFANQCFDLVNAPLCLDYIHDWRSLFQEFYRILSPGGLVQFSCGHPSFDAEYYKTMRYFEVEKVESTWKGFGKPVVVPSFRRSITDAVGPVIESGFRITRFLEPRPTVEFQQADPERYDLFQHRPLFLCIQAQRCP